MKAVGRLGRKEVKQMFYTVLAALLCFIGPTYLITVVNNFVPQTYAVIAGFVCFLVGIVFILKLVKE